MNKQLIFTILTIVAAIGLTACSDDSGSTGESLLTEEDRIIVGCDTFPTQSAITDAIEIYSTPDSFLLGECDGRFGTIHADILAQFTCPIGFEYPEGAVVDSVCLFFYYKSWHGDGHTPMSVSIYEIDKQSLKYTQPYEHNIDIDDYCTISGDNMVLERQRILVAAQPVDSVYDSSTERYVPFVRMRLTDEFAERLFSIKDFASLDQFTEQFKGLYIQSDFGSATLLHVTDINLGVYYHFTYQKQGVDTTVTDVKGFYASDEVRQVNRYIYLNDQLEELKTDTVNNYIVSPAGMYTRISLPLRQISDSIVRTIGVKRPYINKAEIDVEVMNVYDGYSTVTRDDWAQPSSYMLLIKESAVHRFFEDKELPNDTCAILSALTASTVNDSTHYSYSYDLATLMTQAIRDTRNDSVVAESLDMLLVPVSVATTTSSAGTTTILSVKHEQTVTATVVRSSNTYINRRNFEVVYSGF